MERKKEMKKDKEKESRRKCRKEGVRWKEKMRVR